jgi:hypothetical protein
MMSFSLADSQLKSGETTLVTITFSEAVTGVDLAGFTLVEGGTLSDLIEINPAEYTLLFTPTSGFEAGTNMLRFDLATVQSVSTSEVGVGPATSDNYAIDTLAPTVTSFAMADTALAASETSLVTITFSEAVDGFTTADLTVANGMVSGLSTGDGGVTWTGTFTPDEDVTDTTNIITLDNTGVADLAGNAGAGTTDSDNYAIDTALPTATIVVAEDVLTIGETSLVTITFSEAVTGFTSADLTIPNGVVGSVTSGDAGVTWTTTFTPSASISDTSNLITLSNTGVADLSGNAGAGTTDSDNYAIDTLRPTAAIVVADTALKAGETSLVTITFSEAVSGFDNSDLSVANGTLTDVESADGGVTWTATLTPSVATTDTSNIITLNDATVTDPAGNANAGATSSNNYAIDTVPPTATIVVADNSLAIGETSLVTITFSEAVSDFTNADLTIANGTLSSVSSGDGGISWTATLTPGAATTDTSNAITLDNTGVADLAGNAGSGTTDSNNYAIDTLGPTASIVVADTALAIGETSLVTITFSEAVTGFTLADMTVENGLLSGLATSDSITYTATLTPVGGVSDTTNLLTVDKSGVSDGAGNVGFGTTASDNYVLDAQRPTATIVMADTELKAGETSLVTITFSEAVSGFENSDLTIPNGTLSTVSTGDDGVTWTGTFTPTAGVTDTSNAITLDTALVADLAGNTGVGTADSGNFTIATERPTATVVVADTELKAGETSLVTITFSSAVSGFDNSDLSGANGTLSSVSSSDGGVTWTATFTPTTGVTDSSNVITLSNTGVTNAFGNTGLGTTNSNNYAIDTGSTPPEPEPEPEPNTPTVGDDVITLPAAGGMVSAGAGADSVGGGQGDDFVHGNTGDDSLVGGAGADIVRGGQGADFVQGNVGDDLVFGDLGDDLAHGGQGADFVQGNAGDDSVSGDLGDDTVAGGQGADLVFGGGGDDYVSGDLGDDTLTGGAGADLFNFSGGAGRDVIADFSHADGDHIRVSLADAADFTALSAHIAGQGADTVITLGAQTIVLVGVSSGSLVAADFVFG